MTVWRSHISLLALKNNLLWLSLHIDEIFLNAQKQISNFSKQPNNILYLPTQKNYFVFYVFFDSL